MTKRLSVVVMLALALSPTLAFAQAPAPRPGTPPEVLETETLRLAACQLGRNSSEQRLSEEIVNVRTSARQWQERATKAEVELAALKTKYEKPAEKPADKPAAEKPAEPAKDAEKK